MKIIKSTSSINPEEFDRQGFSCVIIEDKEIAPKAFEGCRALERVILKGVTTIREYAFRNTGIKKITIPDTVTEIGNHAFEDSDLEEVKIEGNSLSKIGDQAFAGTLIKKIKFPDSVKQFGYHPFAWTKIERIKIGDTSISHKDGILTISGEIPWKVRELLKELRFVHHIYKLQLKNMENVPHEFMMGANIESVSIGNGTKKIEGHAFCGCSKLRRVYLPESLEEVDPWAFDDCCLGTVTLPQNTKLYVGAFNGAQIKRKIQGGV